MATIARAFVIINMSALDIVILIIVGLGALVGFFRGFIKQLASILSLVVGLMVAKSFYLSLTYYIHPHYVESLTTARVISFIAIWIIISIVFAVVASVITKGLNIIALGWLNRLLGFALGGVKYFILISLCISLIEFIDSNNKLISETKKRDSMLYYPMNKITESFVPVAKKAYDFMLTE